jgi:hypothetical protein
MVATDTILGLEISKHCQKRMSQRGISYEDVEMCIKTGYCYDQRTNHNHKTYIYIYNNISVVVSYRSKTIITVAHQYKRISKWK